MGKPKANGKQTGKPSKTPAIKMPAFEKAENKATVKEAEEGLAAVHSVEANFKKCKKKQHREIKETASSRT